MPRSVNVRDLVSHSGWALPVMRFSPKYVPHKIRRQVENQTTNALWNIVEEQVCNRIEEQHREDRYNDIVRKSKIKTIGLVTLYLIYVLWIIWL